MQEVYKQFGLGEMTIDFIGHAIALHRDDAYMSQPAMDTVLKVKLYYNSLTRFEGTASPYIYPLYGLGELPQVLPPSSSHQTCMSLLVHRCCLLTWASAEYTCHISVQVVGTACILPFCFGLPDF